jgi:hypothetical protein
LFIWSKTYFRNGKTLTELTPEQLDAALGEQGIEMIAPIRRTVILLKHWKISALRPSE